MSLSVDQRAVASSSRAATVDRFIRAATVEHPTVARSSDGFDRAGEAP